jgi:exoribonuclease R
MASYWGAYVTVDGFPRDVYIDGPYSRNRAMDGDEVAVELLPRSQWVTKEEEEIEDALDEELQAEAEAEAEPAVAALAAAAAATTATAESDEEEE